MRWVELDLGQQTQRRDLCEVVQEEKTSESPYEKKKHVSLRERIVSAHGTLLPKMFGWMLFISLFLSLPPSLVLSLYL